VVTDGLDVPIVDELTAWLNDGPATLQELMEAAVHDSFLTLMEQSE
jgi:hypothetical protein